MNPINKFIGHLLFKNITTLRFGHISHTPRINKHLQYFIIFMQTRYNLSYKEICIIFEELYIKEKYDITILEIVK